MNRPGRRGAEEGRRDRRRRWGAALVAALASAQPCGAGEAPRAKTRHNVLLFVADGLRPGSLNEADTPAISALAKRGVAFTDTHSVFPTFTTANASAMATGHKLGDTGDFSNVIDAGFPVPGAGGSLTPFLESDPVLGDVDEHFSGDFLGQGTIMRAARLAGISTSTIGKLGPTLIFDHTERSGAGTIVVDDMTGRGKGIPLDKNVEARLAAAGLPAKAPSRGDNGVAGTFERAGTLVPNTIQQNYFLAVATKVVLPLFKERGAPFMMVFWSRDPDGTQHNQGDSLGRLVPGINGPTSRTAVRNADGDLAALLRALDEQGLADTTDVLAVSDHGFSTISKASTTSGAAKAAYADVAPGKLPPGFPAIDLAHALGLPMLDPDAGYTAVADGRHPSRGNALIGGKREAPAIVVAANGGSDLVYLPEPDRALPRRVVEALAAQDYVSGLFVSDELGPIPGTLPISAVDLKGSAVTPLPAIVVNFRSFSTGCAQAPACAAEVADTGLQQGQGMHGGFGRSDVAVVTVAAGPDFKTGFVDPAPVSNADVGRTMAALLGLEVNDKGVLVGRVLSEAMPGGAMPEVTRSVQRSTRDASGRETVVLTKSVSGVRYFDAAGYPGRTLGLEDAPLVVAP